MSGRDVHGDHEGTPRHSRSHQLRYKLLCDIETSDGETSMAVNRLLSTVVLVLAVSTGVSGGECGVLPPVNTELMVKSLRDVFHLPRGPRNAGNKEIVRRFIGEYFRNMSSISSEALVHEQSFHVPDGESFSDGVNIIYVLPGAQWGSSSDKLLVVVANYDTANSETPGVDDNGSGMAALLETARVLTSVAESCTFDTTIIFAAIDLQRKNIGITSFATDYLIADVLRKFAIPPDHFRGVLLLKTLMNFNQTKKSQTIPEVLSMVDPEIVHAIKDGDNRGNFLAAMSLSHLIIRELAESYDDHWTRVTGQLATSLKPLLYTFELPTSFEVEVFTHGGMLALWHSLSNYTSESFNVVALTDTANLRGYMRKCDLRPCDNLTMALTPNNIEFLRITTTTLVQYLAEDGRPTSQAAPTFEGHMTTPPTTEGPRSPPPTTEGRRTPALTTEGPRTPAPTAAAELAGVNLLVLCVLLAACLLT
ncbi:hypothetical protein LSAT2_026231 [Lamellibrachia satsuma]|nr:hypothetical protein LSAT2_026231 [Lamellibrachia satsuma]